jgi:hypothetical protein
MHRIAIHFTIHFTHSKFRIFRNWREKIPAFRRFGISSVDQRLWAYERKFTQALKAQWG